ncbi:DUF6580 family putative transport protein [Flaviaesturariibacter amylovorans]|uniref:Lysoplasmalogenase n=1 Tax=Flaviaesturariibacter amylovorans TaxID=1084520 RepID=A0ABP8H0X5_9BACT
MKRNTSLILSFGLLVLACSLYRVFDGRPWGFAPQIAMALFSGAIIRDKKFAFLMPLLSMLLSDALYQVLYVNGLSSTPGFYGGQATNYALFLAMTVFGFFIKNIRVGSVLAASVAAPVFYFLLSNFQVWIGGGGYQRPKTFSGLLQCYVDGWPFFTGSLMATVFFSALFFGAWQLMTRRQQQLSPAN